MAQVAEGHISRQVFAVHGFKLQLLYFTPSLQHYLGDVVKVKFSNLKYMEDYLHVNAPYSVVIEAFNPSCYCSHLSSICISVFLASSEFCCSSAAAQFETDALYKDLD